MIQSQRNEDDANDLYGNLMDESLVYPNLLLRPDLLNDSSSDTQSDDHSLHLAIQGISLNSQTPHYPSHRQQQPFQHQAGSVSVPATARPQTGYKKR